MPHARRVPAGNTDGTSSTEGLGDGSGSGVVTEEKVEVLVNMGFSRDQAAASLEAVGGGTEDAVMYLLARTEAQN